ncbi:MAG: carbonic anhydrase family protein [Methylococcales bacterium]|jgi:carbonic anhydrase|nr:carbonic anhydrase family protein [Methylococcales bacterium]MBT7443944.1 carbonic anhydrase family protein [Methylococcales bacterium]
MKLSLPLVAGLLFSSSVFAASGGHWGYSGENGPDNWAKLSADNAACNGRNQSPVNLTGFVESALVPLAMLYKAGGTEVLNNGHTVQVNYAAGSQLIVDAVTFDLKQFHFHAPSENHIDGQSFPLEAHLVHADKNGNLAIVAVMFGAGKENVALKQAWASMPKQAGEKNVLPAVLDVNGILPNMKAYYRFNGSLTTPPCSEGVRWFVMKKPMTASAAQIDALSHTLHHANNRPIQAVNARVILK